MDAPDEPHPMPLRPLLWGLLLPPVWLSFSLAPAALVQGSWPQHMVLALLGGFMGATALALFLDRKMGPPGHGPLVAPPVWWWIAPAILAGLGTSILGSEAGNVMLTWSDSLAAAPEPLPVMPPKWQLALLWSLVNPVCIALVLHGVTQRTLAGSYRPRTAMLGSIIAGAAVIPGPFLQWAAILALPVWLYRHTRSLALALAAFLPSAQGYLLDLFGLGPGVPGFDVTRSDQVLFQPIWFDLLGAALLAVGVFPFLRAFHGPPEVDRP
ncbi:MAG: hypothetical protein KC613_23605 [Myxococcales bacterium]|nr:hypothetical protein [Myxococcales bacterium]MCB9521910.1 hypothetical protein [Myxococcales bacterium]